MGVNNAAVQASFNLKLAGLISWNAVFGPYRLPNPLLPLMPGVIMDKTKLFAYCGCVPGISCGGDRRRLRAYVLGP